MILVLKNPYYISMGIFQTSKKTILLLTILFTFKQRTFLIDYRVICLETFTFVCGTSSSKEGRQ